MQETLKTIGEIFAICGVVGGFIGWGVGKMLDYKKEMTILQTKMEDLCEKHEKLQDEFDDHIKGYNDYKLTHNSTRHK